MKKIMLALMLLSSNAFAVEAEDFVGKYKSSGDECQQDARVYIKLDNDLLEGISKLDITFYSDDASGTWIRLWSGITRAPESTSDDIASLTWKTEVKGNTLSTIEMSVKPSTLAVWIERKSLRKVDENTIVLTEETKQKEGWSIDKQCQLTRSR